MVIADSLTLAIRAIAAQRLRSFLTLLGIAVGIAAVILLTSIGEGIHRYVLAEFTQFGTNVVGVHPGKTKTGGGALSGLPSSARPLSLDDAEALKRLPNVVAVTPSVWGNAEVNGNGRVRRVSVYGVGPGMLQVFKGKVRSGQFLPEEEAGSARAQVVLGPKLKNELFGSENAPWRAGARWRPAVPRDRHHGAQGPVPRHRPRRHRLHPRGARPGIVQTAKASTKSTSPPPKAYPPPAWWPRSRT
jgi:putative ABC transport system permease protein